MTDKKPPSPWWTTAAGIAALAVIGVAFVDRVAEVWEGTAPLLFPHWSQNETFVAATRFAMMAVLAAALAALFYRVARRVYEQRVLKPWLEQYSRPGADAYVARLFEQSRPSCWNPLSPSKFVLMADRLTLEYYKCAGEALCKLIKDLYDNLVNDTNPNMRSKAKHLGDSERNLKALETCFANDTVRSMAKALPRYPQSGSAAYQTAFLVPESQKIVFAFREKVYNPLNTRTDDDPAAVGKIKEAGSGAGEVLAVLEGFLTEVAQQTAQAKAIYDAHRRWTAHRRSCQAKAG